MKGLFRQRLGGAWAWAMWLVAISCAPSAGDDWPQWRGPERDGVWRESGIVDRLPTGGPPVVWRTPIDPGYSGPAVANGRVFVMDRQRTLDAGGEVAPADDGSLPGKERLRCHDANTGKLLWETDYDCSYRLYFPLGPRTTPLIAGNRVYTLGAMGHLRCSDFDDGRLIWSRQFVDEYQAPVPAWGWAAHPLVVDDLVVCLVGGPGAAVVAFDAATGEERWRALSADEVGYSAPILIHAGGTRQLIVWLDTAIYSLDPATGKPLWSEPHPAEGNPMRPVVHIISPAFSPPWLLVSEHYQGSTMLKLADDAPRAVVEWRSSRGRPELNAMLASPVFKDNHLFGLTSDGVLRCLESSTGAVRWETVAVTGKRKQANASAFLVPQEDRCFIFNDQGDLIMARLTAERYEEVDRAHILKPSSFARGRNVVWSHPAFANRCMYARNDEELICVSLAKETPGEANAQTSGT